MITTIIGVILLAALALLMLMNTASNIIWVKRSFGPGPSKEERERMMLEAYENARERESDA